MCKFLFSAEITDAVHVLQDQWLNTQARDKKQTGNSLRKLTREAAVIEVNAHHGLFGMCVILVHVLICYACLHLKVGRCRS